MQRHATALRPLLVLTLATAGVLLALAGCARVTTELTVSEQGTISGSYVYAASDEVAAQMGRDPDSTLRSLKGDTDPIEVQLPGAVEKRYHQDGYTGMEYVLTDVTLDDFNQWSSGSPGLAIVRQGDEYVLAGIIDVPEYDELLWEVPSDAPAPDIHLSITFPGEVVESNGTIDGNTVTWKGAPGEYQAIDARAQALPSSTPTQTAGLVAGKTHSAGADTSSAGISWIVWAAIGGVVLIGAGLVTGFAMRSRSRRRVMAAAAGPMPAGAYSAPSGHAQQFGPAPQYGPTPPGPAPQYNPPPTPPQYGPPPGPTQYTPPPPAPPEHQRSTEG